MKKQQTVQYEKVPMLSVWKEGDKIKFRSTRDIDNFALYGFLKTYIQFLKVDLLKNMRDCNNFDKEEE